MQQPSKAFAHSAALAGATLSYPFGEGIAVFKVGEKIFAAVSAQGICVKTDSTDTAALLIDMGRALKAPYFHASWVLVPHDTEEVTERISTSYALIRASLPKKLQATLL